MFETPQCLNEAPRGRLSGIPVVIGVIFVAESECLDNLHFSIFENYVVSIADSATLVIL